MTNITTPTAISIWQGSGQTGQGVSGYSTNRSGQDFGFGAAFQSANFSLSAPQSPGTFGTAGVINTIPFKLSDAGITSFTSAKIRGVLSAANTVSAVPDFSAGLAIFTNPMLDPMAPGAPNLIYGNAYDATMPGPLPALGAAAAFSFSRRLRRRVKASARSC
jgi:hypothetical protein